MRKGPFWGGNGLGIPMVALLCSCALRAGAPLTLEGDYWMPYNGDGKAETGYVIDLAKAIFEPKGIPVVYAVTPWVRAIEDARHGKCMAIIGALKHEVPDFIFPEEETGRGSFVFYVKAGVDWKYTGVDSLRGRTLGVVKDYAYYPALDDYIKANPDGVRLGFGSSALDGNLRLLLLDRLDAVIDDDSVMRFAIAKKGLKGKVVPAGAGSDAQRNYLAFSPVHPDSRMYAGILAEGLQNLRKSGELKKILAKYGLSDWK